MIDFTPYTNLVRKHSEALMPDVCEVVRTGPPTVDETGYETPGEEVVALTTRCRLQGLNGDERLQASQIQAQVEAKAAIPWSAQIFPTDTLRIAGVDFNVRAVLPRSDAHAPHRDVLVSRSG